ncbi:hypothetical protein ACFQ0G_27850 [Streptomyces chiangmaiensis]
MRPRRSASRAWTVRTCPASPPRRTGAGPSLRSSGRRCRPAAPPVRRGQRGRLAPRRPACPRAARPAGARDKALRGTDGWLPTEDFLAEYTSKQDRKEFGQRLTDHGLRHIAARGWTTEDGTHTRIYLLHFDTATVVDDLGSNKFASFNSLEYAVRDAHDSVMDSAFPGEARIRDISRSVYVEPKPYGAQQVREAYLRAGDVFAVIIQSRKGTTPAVPFQQTVTLQTELLD